MPIALDKIIWTGKSTGVVLEEYQGKYSLKAVQKYTSQGQEKVSYDWTFKEKWNPDTRKREMPDKANCANGIYLGDATQAIASLREFLRQLGGSAGPAVQKPVEDEDGSPFPF